MAVRVRTDDFCERLITFLFQHNQYFPWIFVNLDWLLTTLSGVFVGCDNIIVLLAMWASENHRYSRKGYFSLSLRPFTTSTVQTRSSFAFCPKPQSIRLQSVPIELWAWLNKNKYAKRTWRSIQSQLRPEYYNLIFNFEGRQRQHKFFST